MRSPNVILAGLCAGALATGGLLWLWSDSDSGPPSGVPAEGRPAATEPGDIQPATASDPTQTRDPQARTELVVEATADRPTRGDQSAATEPGPMVLVVGGKPPRPMPGIEVAWIDRERGYELRKSLRDAERIRTTEVDLPHRFGERATTDAEGRVQLPAITSRHVVAATDSNKELFGAGTLRPGNRELKITLEQDEELRILVRGFDDRPRGGVPVTVHAGSAFGNARDVWKGKTDAQGLAIVRHFQRARRSSSGGRYGSRSGGRSSSRTDIRSFLSSTQRSSPAPSSTQQKAPAKRRYAAAIALPLAVPVAVEFDGEPAPEEPVELRLPPLQPLTATVVHESGAKLISTVRAYLYSVRSADDDIEEPLERTFDRLYASKPVGEDPIEFGPVGLGAELQPLLRFPGQRGGQRLPKFTSSPDEQPQHILLEIPKEFSVIAGRAVLADEQPLADAEILYAITTPQGTLVQSEAQSLGDGRFDFVCKPRGEPRPHRVQLRWTDPEGVLYGAERTLGALEPGERHDLRDLVLTPLPPLVSGRVVDDRGVPVPAARLSIQYRIQTSSGGERWVTLPRVGARPDDEGRYEVFGSAPPQAIRLVARARGHFDVSSDPIAAGATVDVQMQRHGQLTGRILLPSWLPRG
ncbi:MAG: carboxypeptidase-like regulatory domain-containing protein, partial [Planctomycetota bacterium]|nr:carboxypeptidase-like regulatory domain-containing protein [Planctomycetota bacterium]